LVAPPLSTMLVTMPVPFPPLRMLVWPVSLHEAIRVAATGVPARELQHIGARRDARHQVLSPLAPRYVTLMTLVFHCRCDTDDVQVRHRIHRAEAGQELVGVAHAVARVEAFAPHNVPVIP
jgi:hypothetical protein